MNLIPLLSSRKTVVLTIAAFSSLCLNTLAAAATLQATALRCEYRKDPVGIDQTTPRLSWQVEAGKNRRGVMQGAYQILVASSADLLRHDQADLWDSGPVQSDQSLHVAYGGKPLSSAETCFWKVRIWDQEGNASAWSEPAKWTMGLLKPSDWKAQWIGYEASAQDTTSSALKKLLRLDDEKWVWANLAQPGDQAPGTVYFRKVIQIPANRLVKQATFALAADDTALEFGRHRLPELVQEHECAL